MAAILHDSTAAAILYTRPRAILLAMITMRKLSHRFPFLSYMSMALCVVALWATRALLLWKDLMQNVGIHFGLMVSALVSESSSPG